MRIVIDGERFNIREVLDTDLPQIVTEEGPEFYLAKDRTHAGEAVRERYVDMAENDPEELLCIVGAESLVKWALGEWAGPGSTAVRSLSEWFDLWLDHPEEDLATYDGRECDVTRVGTLSREIGFMPTIAYRSN